MFAWWCWLTLRRWIYGENEWKVSLCEVNLRRFAGRRGNTRSSFVKTISTTDSALTNDQAVHTFMTGVFLEESESDLKSTNFETTPRFWNEILDWESGIEGQREHTIGCRLTIHQSNTPKFVFNEHTLTSSQLFRFAMNCSDELLGCSAVDE